jgi:hypothetical protein
MSVEQVVMIRHMPGNAEPRPIRPLATLPRQPRCKQAIDRGARRPGPENVVTESPGAGAPARADRGVASVTPALEDWPGRVLKVFREKIQLNVLAGVPALS